MRVSRKVPILGALLAVGWLAAGCAGPQVTTDWDRAADFRAYRTFAWAPSRATGDVPGEYDILDKRIRRAVDAELQARGMTSARSEKSADVLLVYRLHTRDRIDVYRHYGWRFGPRTVATREKEGTLVLQVVDAHQQAVVWEGRGTDVLRPSDHPDEQVGKVVAKILEGFPPQ
ncbi:MAG: DUF4136 domain-containing protein [bacterium]